MAMAMVLLDMSIILVDGMRFFLTNVRTPSLLSRFGLLSDSMQVVEFHQPLSELDPKTIEEFLLELFRETILPMYQILLINLVVWERLVARKNFSR